MITTVLLAAAVHMLAVAHTAIAAAGLQQPFSLAASAALDAPSSSSSIACRQVPPLFPKQTALDSRLNKLFTTAAFQEKTQDALSAVIRVP
jgi:hypothetical protein